MSDNQLFQVTNDISTQDENVETSWTLAALNLVCFLLPKTRETDEENQLRSATQMKHRSGIPMIDRETPSFASPSSEGSGRQTGEDMCGKFYPFIANRLVKQAGTPGSAAIALH